MAVGGRLGVRDEWRRALGGDGGARQQYSVSGELWCEASGGEACS